jgi:multidrug resistance efflux pump
MIPVMTDLDASTVLRLAVLAGLAGFLVFCASYSLTVWRKRNHDRPSPFRWGSAIMAAGVFAALASWIFNEYTDRPGVVSGNDLFVVHSRRDAQVTLLAEHGPLEAGQLLAEFTPPALAGQLAIIGNHIDEARARLAALEMRPLSVDALLLQRQGQLRTQLDQARTFRFDLRKSLRELEKDRLKLLTDWTREESEIETQLASARQSMNTAKEKIGIAKNSVERAADLRRREIVSMQVVDDRSTAVLTLTSERDRAEAEVAALTGRLQSLKTRYSTALRALESQLAVVENDLKTVTLAHDNAEQSLIEVETLVRSDSARAAKATGQEIEAARYQLAALQAERERVISMTQVRAPFSGQVVFRHTAPGFAKDNAPVLALSPGSGFIATVRLAADTISEIAEAGPVRFALKDGILNRFFSGSFRRAVPTAADSDFVMAEFDAELPVEAITRIAASGEGIRVQLDWAPSINNNSIFRISVVIAVLGFLGVLLSGLKPLIFGRRQSAAVGADIVARSSAPPPLSRDILPPLAKLRLRALAAVFHLKLRTGDLQPEYLTMLRQALDEFGDDAVSVMQSEIHFDASIREAAEEWIRRHGDHGLSRVIAYLAPRFAPIAT